MQGPRSKKPGPDFNPEFKFDSDGRWAMPNEASGGNAGETERFRRNRRGLTGAVDGSRPSSAKGGGQCWRQ